MTQYAKKFDFLSRLVALAGNSILFVNDLPSKVAGDYLYNQLLRSTGSAALNFAECQGSKSDKDYLYKARISLKELRESEVNFQIMKFTGIGGKKRDELQNECIQLIKILTTIIKNRESETSV